MIKYEGKHKEYIRNAPPCEIDVRATTRTNEAILDIDRFAEAFVCDNGRRKQRRYHNDRPDSAGFFSLFFRYYVQSDLYLLSFQIVIGIRTKKRIEIAEGVQGHVIGKRDLNLEVVIGNLDLEVGIGRKGKGADQGMRF